MTADDPPRPPDDRLARAEAALRGSPVPDGPSPDLVARTRSALRAADGRGTRRPDPRRKLMFAMFKLTSAAALAFAAAGLSYLAVTPPAGATTAFQETAKKLQEARTLSYRSLVRLPGQAAAISMREFSKDPGLIRTEIGDPPTATNVMDAGRGKILILNLALKTAFVQDWDVDAKLKAGLEQRASTTVERLRSMAGREEKPAGRRKIGDVEAQGFRVDEDGSAWTVWIDAAKKLPLLMETTAPIPGVGEASVEVSDFRIDPPLDDALFRVDPPEGFAVQKLETPLTADGEKSLIDLLRTYAEAGEGDFPPRLDDIPAIQKRFSKQKWSADDPRMFRHAQSLAAASVFVQFTLKDAHGYAPDGAKLGDAKRVIFWYRPKDAKAYRAIFADLHAEDVDADRLPEKPKF